MKNFVLAGVILLLFAFVSCESWEYINLGNGGDSTNYQAQISHVTTSLTSDMVIHLDADTTWLLTDSMFVEIRPYTDTPSDSVMAYWGSSLMQIAVGASLSITLPDSLEEDFPIRLMARSGRSKVLVLSPQMEKPAVSLYPNPVLDSVLYLQVDSRVSAPFDVSFYDLTGQLVKQESGFHQGLVSKHTLDVKRFHRGLYMVALHMSDQNVVSKLIINTPAE